MYRFILIFFVILSVPASMFSMDYPQVSFAFSVSDASGNTQEGATTFEGSAPITATFTATVNYDADYQLIGEWRKWSTGGSIDSPDIVRHENPTEFTFTNATTDSVAFYGYVVYNDNRDTIFFDKEHYWWQPGGTPLTVTTYESKLTFPNAFSPNGDGYNDVFKAKEYQSIVEFHAKIFNRWGQKLYEWDDVNGGWDGTFHGHPVKDGAYYILVKARGSDGQVFEIKKDVNILRDYIDDTTSSSE